MHTQLIQMEKVTVTLKMLSDKTRLTMVKILEGNECCVCEFVALFEMSQPAISQHLRKLKDVGLVNESRKGQWIFYSLNRNSEVFPLVQSILEHIPDQNEKLNELVKQGLRISCN